jgi:hypothetical protein
LVKCVLLAHFLVALIIEVVPALVLSLGKSDVVAHVEGADVNNQPE